MGLEHVEPGTTRVPVRRGAAMLGAMEYDVVVVGAGVAGLSAAAWLGRYRRRTLVVDAGEARNRWAEQAHGLIGSDPVDPATLRQRGRRALDTYPDVEIEHGRARGARREGHGFAVDVPRGTVRAQRLILATGVRDAFPAIRGFFDHYGKDVQHCPTCDGFDARGHAVAVFGHERHVVDFAAELLNWAERVRIVTDGPPLDIGAGTRARLAEHEVEVLEGEAAELLGPAGRLEGVRLAGGGRVRCTKAFFTIDHHPVTGLAEQLGCALDAEGYVDVDHEARTSVPGVYAAGDLTPGMQLIAVGAGKGTVAGVSCSESLHGQSVLANGLRPAPTSSQLP